ncbi:SRPBCC family protein [Streptomyces sp. ME19-01-6]|nr:SRPBCC family protein [Streptomyces sp. ME19-01-6]MDX3229116.1 SRPBCC family protein [Streptomyces sp. ME19-01-6]
MECYHCATIHPELIEVLPEFADGYAAQYYVGHGAEFGEDVQGFTVDGSEGLDRIPGVADDQDRRYYAITVRPQVFINLVPDHVIFHRMYRWHPTVRSSSATGCTCRTSWRAARTWTGR